MGSLIRVSCRIFPGMGNVDACMHQCTHLGFVVFHEILDAFKNKKHQIQL